MRTYRVVFQRNRIPTAHEVVEPEARPNQIQPEVDGQAEPPAPEPAQPERLLLNGNLGTEQNGDNDVPLLNRLNLNGENQNGEEDADEEANADEDADADQDSDQPDH